jgi:3-phenylpropionate/trans-cinnamate dioxygenase ferredoxin component
MSVSRVRVCSRGDVPAEEARRFDVEGRRIAVVNLGEEFRAIGDECSHADYSLAEGMVWADECTLECPKHGSAFSLATGEPTTLPAIRPVPVYPVTVEGDDVYLELDDPEEGR